ncbi:MAG: hypothetical protein ACYC6A_24190 [Armatimonadota bacterium]
MLTCDCEKCRENKLFHWSMLLQGVHPSDAREAVAYDLGHNEIARFTVTAADCYNSSGGYWSLFRLADHPKTREYNAAFVTFA